MPLFILFCFLGCKNENKQLEYENVYVSGLRVSGDNEIEPAFKVLRISSDSLNSLEGDFIFIKFRDNSEKCEKIIFDESLPSDTFQLFGTMHYNKEKMFQFMEVYSCE